MDLRNSQNMDEDSKNTDTINQDIKNYQCYGCGFITNSLLKKDTQFFDEQMELLPNLYKELMGEDVLIEMAREVATKLRDNLTVDWAVKESVRARLRLLIKQLLRKYRYPPDDQKNAIDMVLMQAEVISESSILY